jgi:hypothetical protein
MKRQRMQPSTRRADHNSSSVVKMRFSEHEADCKAHPSASATLIAPVVIPRELWYNDIELGFFAWESHDPSQARKLCRQR